ncbi:ATP-binding protein [Pseudobutyrivibrio xylanivorans]|uniref:AAA family ATPase n=1 Tax=Pseudobutyrivibrio xylanivorans TaxID=185007 RepID=A0A5P6VUI6_PSEXY|nr:ATP-binding protein [Pseudobutyrivibrio xylanivorans]QFJ56130.1 AAA family ATPase [Pseudobutyrivibrio xylanivorans]
MTNPFTLSFGKQPLTYISRLEQTNEVVENFSSEPANCMMYMITGVRGAGKTVLMTSIAKELAEDKKWIVVELNPELDLLEQLAAKLYNLPESHVLFTKAKIDLSFFGIGLSVEGGQQFTSIDTAIETMLSLLKKEGKKVLVLLDEVTNNKSLRILAHSFQIYIRKELDIFILMAGLYENIYQLQNEKSLTFLYRAPKIHMLPLNTGAIIDSYKSIFDIDQKSAKEMADETKGYAFAYQVLGYVKWRNPEKTLKQILPEYEQYLEEYVYQKIWSELSDTDRNVLFALEGKEEIKIKELRDKINMSSSLFSTYRDRLDKKGLIDTSKYGFIGLLLPRFSNFVEKQR